PQGALRDDRAQADGQEGRRCRVRARRARHVQRLAVVPQARRSAGDLRLDLGTIDTDQPVPALSDRKGVDVAFEHVGPDTFNGSLLCLKRGGRLVTCGSTSGQSTPINLFQLYLQQYRIFGSFGASIRNVRESLAKMA